MKKNWWNSLRTKIIAWSFVPTTIILSAVAWFTFYSYQIVVGDLAVKQEIALLDTKVVQAAQGINAQINNILRPIILSIDIKPELPREVRAQNILDQAPNLDFFDGGIYFVDQSGIVYKSQSERPELIGQDWSDTYQFRYVRDNPPGSGPITDIRIIGQNGEGIACVIWPMHNTQVEFIGATYLCLAITANKQENLYKTVIDLSLGKNVYILDGNQRILFASDPAQLGKDLSKEDYIQQLFQSESGSIRYKKGTTDKVVIYSSLVRGKNPNTFWSLVSEKNWSDIMQPTLPYRQLLIFLLALGVIVPVLVTSYGVRHITEPIQKLIKAAEQVTAGQFKQRIEVKTGDEIETLTDQFNLMSAELDESYSSLEKKISDRTRELAIMNSILSVASRSLDIQEILGESLNKTLELLGFAAGAAFKIDIDQKSIDLVASTFKPAITRNLANKDAIAGWASTEAYPQEVVLFNLEDLHHEKIKGQLSRSGFKGFIFIPLSSKGRLMGFFILGKRQPVKLSPEERALLNSIGKQVGVALENAHLYEQAEQTAITAERSRLARELHDAVTQTLFSANLIADVIPRIWKRNPEEGMQNLEELRQLTRGALAEMRTLLLEMRPESIERSDLKGLLTQLCDAFTGRVRVPISLEILGGHDPALDVKIVFFRIAQEALNNIAKHSGASQVEVYLDSKPEKLHMVIKDNGLGFDPGAIASGHLGISIMQERANSIGARLKVNSQSGQGTIVELMWKSARKE
jgi:nitrate/nitrite-specific signal transduction histidine kinase